jgi:hypothetical protein
MSRYDIRIDIFGTYHDAEIEDDLTINELLDEIWGEFADEIRAKYSDQIGDMQSRPSFYLWKPNAQGVLQGSTLVRNSGGQLVFGMTPPTLEALPLSWAELETFRVIEPSIHQRARLLDLVSSRQRELVITKVPLVIGRAGGGKQFTRWPRFEIDLKGHEAARTLSREQCVIIYRNNYFYLYALAGTSATYINDVAIPVETATPIQDGDVIKMTDAYPPVQIKFLAPIYYSVNLK